MKTRETMTVLDAMENLIAHLLQVFPKENVESLRNKIVEVIDVLVDVEKSDEEEFLAAVGITMHKFIDVMNRQLGTNYGIVNYSHWERFDA